MAWAELLPDRARSSRHPARSRGSVRPDCRCGERAASVRAAGEVGGRGIDDATVWTLRAELPLPPEVLLLDVLQVFVGICVASLFEAVVRA